jgi:hypothetical protein
LSLYLYFLIIIVLGIVCDIYKKFLQYISFPYIFNILSLISTKTDDFFISLGEPFQYHVKSDSLHFSSRSSPFLWLCLWFNFCPSVFWAACFSLTCLASVLGSGHQHSQLFLFAKLLFQVFILAIQVSAPKTLP